MHGGKVLDKLTIDLRNNITGDLMPVIVDIYDNSLSRRWLVALNDLLHNQYHLEKNYCFLGFPQHARDGQYILDQVNASITAINQSNIGYTIDDWFDIKEVLASGDMTWEGSGGRINHDRFNHLHRYFEDLQGVSGRTTQYFQRADPTTRWHIRQLNLLCHEFECWALSWRKSFTAPDWQRPSQLMCWLNAPRFVLQQEDYELFGIDSINRSTGGVFVGVNKAVGKHHWEVFNDEGRESRVGELVSTTLRSQTEAAGDFDIEWGKDPSAFEWQQQTLREFRQWLIRNGFEPDDPALTIGHPQIGQVDLDRTFGSNDHAHIWKCLNTHLDVYRVTTSDSQAVYDYTWSDPDYREQQIKIIEGNK